MGGALRTEPCALCPQKYSFFLQRFGGLQRISLKGNHAGGIIPARQHWKNIKSYE